MKLRLLFLLFGITYFCHGLLFGQTKLNVNGSLLTGDKKPQFAIFDSLTESSDFRIYLASKDISVMNNVYTLGQIRDIRGSNANINTDNYYRYFSFSENFVFGFTAYLGAIYEGVLSQISALNDYKSLTTIGYFDYGGRISLGVPIVFEDIKFYPLLNIGYSFRQASITYVDNLNLATGAQIQDAIKNRTGNQGDGLDIGALAIADFSKLVKTLQPVLYFQFENFVNTLDEKLNNFPKTIPRTFEMDLKNPFRINFGGRINVMNYFDFNGEVLAANNVPEYRIMFSRKFETNTLGLYATMNEHTVLDYSRNIFGFILGFHKPGKHDYLDINLTYDNDAYFGLGIGFNL